MKLLKITYPYKGEKADFPVKLEEKEKLGIIFGNPARLVMSDAINLYDKLSIEDTVKNMAITITLKK